MGTSSRNGIPSVGSPAFAKYGPTVPAQTAQDRQSASRIHVSTETNRTFGTLFRTEALSSLLARLLMHTRTTMRACRHACCLVSSWLTGEERPLVSPRCERLSFKCFPSSTITVCFKFRQHFSVVGGIVNAGQDYFHPVGRATTRLKKRYKR